MNDYRLAPYRADGHRLVHNINPPCGPVANATLRANWPRVHSALVPTLILAARRVPYAIRGVGVCQNCFPEVR